MKKKKVLVTGASGFIGAYVVENLLAKGFSVIALKRKSSDLWRLKSYLHQIHWLDLEDSNWENEVIQAAPEVLVHAAWSGVTADTRDNWESQLLNLDFIYALLRISEKAGIKRIITLGSQAEYGAFEGRIHEGYPIHPTTAYGGVKVAALQLLKLFAEERKLEWYWLRIFSVFGPKEDPNWFISFVINQILEGKTLNLTLCEQKYDYLYIQDLSEAIEKVIISTRKPSGVYNISSNQSIPLKEIVNRVKELVGGESAINYGALPYRPNQVMRMEGDAKLFFDTFGALTFTPLLQGLKNTVDFVRKEKLKLN